MADFNGTILQYFHWYIPNTGTLWDEVQSRAATLARAGFTALWLPPAYKGFKGIDDVGYGVYDLFDLGEFHQRDTVRTKYGTRDQYLRAIAAAHQAGLQVYADAVFNHRNGGDNLESVEAIPVAFEDRNCAIGCAEAIKVWTNFTFPGRGDTYSTMKWRWYHFDSVNYNADRPQETTIYRFKDKHFETEVDPRYGNYDFLMACDLDTNEPEVRAELKHWGEWILDTTQVDGFRLDAVKHMRASFFTDWLAHVRRYAQRSLFAVGEYWSGDVEALHWFITETQGQLSLFDVPLHYNFWIASRAGGRYDMRRILDGTLMQQQPTLAVTFVENHDSQPLQALESVVEPWFKPLAYALILLRREGYPCVFYGDYYGAHYTDKGRDGKEYEIWLPRHRWLIDKFLYARRHYAYGDQHDYFDHPDVIGWTRLGNAEHPQAIAVVMSDGPGGCKWMDTGRPNVVFYDLTEHIPDRIQTNASGWGPFTCRGGSVSVWVEQSSH